MVGKNLSEEHKKATEAEQVELDKRLEVMQTHIDHAKQIWQVYNDFQMQTINDRLNEINAKEGQAVEAVKKTNAYRLAQAQGNQAKMDALENKAKNKFHKDRVAAFRSKQKLAISNVIIDYISGIAKDVGKAGLIATITSAPLLLAAQAAAIAMITAQKPPEKFAQGGDFVTSGPQTIIVGDNPGGRERVQVTPLSSPNVAGPSSGNTVNVVFNNSVMSSDYTEDVIIPQIKEAVRRGADIGIS